MHGFGVNGLLIAQPMMPTNSISVKPLTITFCLYVANLRLTLY